MYSWFYKLVYKCSFGAFKKKLSLLQHGWSLMVSKDSWLVQSGYVRSFLESRAVDFNGNPLPWMNYGMIGFLSERLNSSLNVFEYGSGNSTFFLAGYVNKVVSIEYDAKWFDRIKENIINNNILNIEYIYCSLKDNYQEQILRQDFFFDIVVVDGRHRVECAKNALDKLTPNGILILDDSNREKYKPVFEYFISKGFAYLTFSGLKPTGFGTDFSTIFYRRSENIFGL